jgi:hypothetical protein
LFRSAVRQAARLVQVAAPSGVETGRSRPYRGPLCRRCRSGRWRCRRCCCRLHRCRWLSRHRRRRRRRSTAARCGHTGRSWSCLLSFSYPHCGSLCGRRCPLALCCHRRKSCCRGSRTCSSRRQSYSRRRNCRPGGIYRMLPRDFHPGCWSSKSVSDPRGRRLRSAGSRHLFNQIQGHLGVDMSVRMDWIARPPRPHGLDLLFHAAVVAANQLDPIEDRSRRQALPELKFLQLEI